MKSLPSVFAGLMAVVLASACLPITASAVVTTWTASDDLYTNTRVTNLVVNEGTNRILVGSQYYGYVRFDTGSTFSYSSLSDIESAVLRIFLPYNGSNGSGTVTALNILDSSDNWNDGGSNPAVGAAFAPSIGSLSSSITVNGTTTPGVYWEWDVTSLVKSADAGLGNNIMSFRLDSPVTIRFAGSDHATGFYPQLVVTAVPEPQSWVLLGLGLTALAVFRRRQRKVSSVA